MVVLSNRRLGPSAELLVSHEVAEVALREVAAAGRPVAQARWEHELVEWLDRCAASGPPGIDVSDIAWTPDHFERQRGFLLAAIEQAAAAAASADAPHLRVLARWAQMIAAHPRESVSVGRRWQWPSPEVTA
jgi:hypothetical protein